MREIRQADELRPISIDTSFNRYAEGCALISFGHTRVLCTASVEEKQPPFLRNTEKGWVTAEYGMLPRATHTRGGREAARGKQGGRTVEIQRLIGRSLRAVVDLEALGPRSISIDCDVLQADGGTRTAAITGSWVALRIAINRLLAEGVLKSDPIIGQVAAVSCGFVDGAPLLDLQYSEDSQAEMDANFIMTEDGGVIEVQATAEDRPLHWDQFMALKKLADKGIHDLAEYQRSAVAAA
ncbi:RNAse PH [Mariprofundus ferrinatatus]|uniref:Ribonuclease PH n=1 Tax=Mariprofundus ferrinatatus TaxID=1921087 RepID=A0A2K8L1V2_9PROT|nr:ribonuclease PH [Mariprofundus ferrinatatus]ATX81223.1 RNAse PH [Mariprofundus ferrinatatus]